MKKRNFVIIICLALLLGCRGEPLLKPVSDVFAYVAEQEEPTSGEPISEPEVYSEPIDPTPTSIPANSTDPRQDAISPVPELTPSEPAPPEPTQPTDPPAPTTAALQLYTHPPLISANDLDTTGLSNKKLGWYFMKNNENLPTRGAAEIDISVYDGYYLGDTTQ